MRIREVYGYVVTGRFVIFFVIPLSLISLMGYGGDSFLYQSYIKSVEHVSYDFFIIFFVIFISMLASFLSLFLNIGFKPMDSPRGIVDSTKTLLGLVLFYSFAFYTMVSISYGWAGGLVDKFIFFMTNYGIILLSSAIFLNIIGWIVKKGTLK
ncbi:hypothetical protein [Marinobacterium ramblicola]|uniref:hypothetical protein n=1 Tax=Marinobacterium ramblicola TaxID=2849041 RepID=UPI001C2DCB43|nr:hypothetical protein [Marinobacterium ramblicola]